MKKSMEAEEIRVRDVIESDRLNLAFHSLDLLKNDLSSLLNDYFPHAETPKIKIREEKGVYRVTVEAVCKKDI